MLNTANGPRAIGDKSEAIAIIAKPRSKCVAWTAWFSDSGSVHADKYMYPARETPRWLSAVSCPKGGSQRRAGQISSVGFAGRAQKIKERRPSAGAAFAWK